MKAISSSDGTAFPFELRTTTTTSSVFSFGISSASAISTAGRSFGKQTKNTIKAAAHRHSVKRSVALAAKSAGTLSTANDASSGLVTSTTLKSFGGFNFGVTTGTTVTTTTSITAAPSFNFQTSTDAAPFTFEPKVTSAAPMPTFGTDSTVFTSLPSKVTWLTQIGDTFTFTTRTTPYGMPAATITTTAMAKPEDSNVDSSLALGTSSETSADRIASTATTQSVDSPILSPSQNKTEDQVDEQEKKKVLNEQSDKVANESIVKEENRHASACSELSQVIEKLNDINFSLSILICIFFIFVAFHISSFFN